MIDTSALVGILLVEPDAERFIGAVASVRLLSDVSRVELSCVITAMPAGSDVALLLRSSL